MANSPGKIDPRSTSEVDRHIGARIRARRLEISLSQQRLAETIGVTFQQVQKYEKGVNRVSAATLIAIAQALDVQFSALLPSQKRGGSGPGVLPLDDDAFNDLGASYARLNKEGRRLLVETARTFAATAHLQARRK